MTLRSVRSLNISVSKFSILKPATRYIEDIDWWTITSHNELMLEMITTKHRTSPTSNRRTLLVIYQPRQIFAFSVIRCINPNERNQTTISFCSLMNAVSIFNTFCDKLETCLPIMKRVIFFVHLPYTIGLSYLTQRPGNWTDSPLSVYRMKFLDDLSRCVERLFMQFWYWSGKKSRIEVWLDTLRRFSLSVYMLSKGLK